ncbi:MAG: beta-glucosidase, partial [Paraprevotella sp.]|nr:beta-glucosidase [Paraprevotella sp.]
IISKTIIMGLSSLVCVTLHAQVPCLGTNPIDEVIQALTLDEKLDLIIGSSGNVDSQSSATIGNASNLVAGAAGQQNAVHRLGIPATVLADGPAGLRISPTREGTPKTFYCTHFPVATVMGAT